MATPIREDEPQIRFCRFCGSEMTGTKCPWRCTAGDDEPRQRYADELPERDFYEGDSPDF